MSPHLGLGNIPVGLGLQASASGDVAKPSDLDVVDSNNAMADIDALFATVASGDAPVAFGLPTVPKTTAHAKDQAVVKTEPPPRQRSDSLVSFEGTPMEMEDGEQEATRGNARDFGIESRTAPA